MEGWTDGKPVRLAEGEPVGRGTIGTAIGDGLAVGRLVVAAVVSTVGL